MRVINYKLGTVGFRMLFSLKDSIFFVIPDLFRFPEKFASFPHVLDFVKNNEVFEHSHITRNVFCQNKHKK